MKVKKGLAILLSSVMVLQMSVLSFAQGDYPVAQEKSFDIDEETHIGTESEVDGGYVTTATFAAAEDDIETDENEGHEAGITYTANPNTDAGFNFANWIYTTSGNEEPGRSFDQSITFYADSGLLSIIAYFTRIINAAPEPVSNVSNDTPAPVENTEPQVPEEPDTTGQINIIDTSAGNALPTTELGEALASTRTISMNICNISPRQYSKAVQETVAKTPDGGNIVIETNQVACFDKNMMQAFAKKSTVNIFVVFKNKAGKKVLVTIPAGYDVMSLLDENGYCGFEHLAAVLGAKEL